MKRSDFEEAIRQAIERRPNNGDAKRTVDEFNFGDLYAAVVRIETVEAARTFYEGYVKHGMRVHGQTRERAEYVAKSNIGWFFGEGWPEDRIRLWTEACGAVHPVFGAMIPKATEAFSAGQKAARGGEGE